MNKKTHLSIMKIIVIITTVIIYHLSDDLLDVIFTKYTTIGKIIALIVFIIILELAHSYIKGNSNDPES